jgi:hypothetical protein
LNIVFVIISTYTKDAYFTFVVMQGVMFIWVIIVATYRLCYWKCSISCDYDFVTHKACMYWRYLSNVLLLLWVFMLMKLLIQRARYKYIRSFYHCPSLYLGCLYYFRCLF